MKEFIEKNVLCIFGSPHKDGFTAKLNNYFLDHISKYGLSYISKINAYEMNAMPCIDCKVCQKEERCTFKDMDSIDKLLRESDILVISTPVYNMSFPSPLKAIFDRFQRYYSARFSMDIKPPIKRRKYAVLLATCGSEDLKSIEIMKLQLERMFTIINTNLRQIIIWKGTDNKNFNIEEEKRKSDKKIIEFLSDL